MTWTRISQRTVGAAVAELDNDHKGMVDIGLKIGCSREGVRLALNQAVVDGVIPVNPFTRDARRKESEQQRAIRKAVREATKKPKVICFVCGKPTTLYLLNHYKRVLANPRYTGRGLMFGRHKQCVEKERPCGACGKTVALTPSKRWGLAHGHTKEVCCDTNCSRVLALRAKQAAS